MSTLTLPTAEDVIQARQRIGAEVETTPVLRSKAIDRCFGMEVFFKCEHLQTTGSFKFRGASHALSWIQDDCSGVATHSSGNHGAALAKAAERRGIVAEVVMPRNAIKAKIDAVKAHGGRVHFCDATQSAREAGLQRFVNDGLIAVPPYDHPHIITGQGTLALELMEQVTGLDAIFAPIGGGGLISGIALATLTQPEEQRPVVIGVEPQGADDTRRSLEQGHRIKDHHPNTIADGLRALVGTLNFSIIQSHVAEVASVSEEAILKAMEVLWRELKQVVEPSGAVALAGLIQRLDRFQGQRVAIILSGGNLDLPHPLIEQ